MTQEEFNARFPAGIPAGWQCDEDFWLFRPERPTDAARLQQIGPGKTLEDIVRAFSIDGETCVLEISVANFLDTGVWS